jgi:hypothetical protein
LGLIAKGKREVPGQLVKEAGLLSWLVVRFTGSEKLIYERGLRKAAKNSSNLSINSA